VAVHHFTLVVWDDGDWDLLHGGGQGTVFIKPAPAGDVASIADEVVVGVRDADRDNVGLERHGLAESQERQVVLKGPGVELGVCGDDLNLSLHVWVRLGRLLQVELPEPQQHLVGLSVLDAVCSGDGPVLVHECRAALV